MSKLQIPSFILMIYHRGTEKKWWSGFAETAKSRSESTVYTLCSLCLCGGKWVETNSGLRKGRGLG